MTDHRELPTAGPFRLAPESFPITFRAFRTDDDRKVWERTFTLEDLDEQHGLGALVIPALAKREGVAVWIEIEYGDGSRARACLDAEDA